MGLSLNASKAQQNLINSATEAMEVLKGRLFDSLGGEMSKVVANVAAKKHDANAFEPDLLSAVAEGESRSLTTSSSEAISFEAKVPLDSERQSEMWDVVTEGNLRSLQGNHEHTHARPGQTVWGEGMQGQHKSKATSEKEIPHWDFGGLGREDTESGLMKNSANTAFGEDRGIAASIIALMLSDALNMSVSVL